LTPESNRSYGFRVIARDAAGNVEAKATAPEAMVKTGDVDRPITCATASGTYDAVRGLFRVDWTGSDFGDTGLASVETYVVIDGGAPQKIAASPAGRPTGGNYGGTVLYQVPAGTHSYRFYTVGIGGEETARTPDADPPGRGRPCLRRRDLHAAQPAASQRLQRAEGPGGPVVHPLRRCRADGPCHGLGHRRNDPHDKVAANDRTRLVRFPKLDGTGTPINVGIASSQFASIGSTIALDFGARGITGSPNTNVGDGYYQWCSSTWTAASPTAWRRPTHSSACWAT
jgi:hypothetical protein